MKIIGVTGGVGAGKSTVLDYFEKKWDAYIIKADLVGHLVMEPGGSCYEKVIELFGKNIIKDDKTIDRKMVSDVVFSHAEKLNALNALIHPAVKAYILKEIEYQKNLGRKLCLVEAALLLEENYQEFCDEVWYIHTDKEIRIQRLIESRGYTKEKAESIIKKQASDEFFYHNTDYTVENNGDLDQTYMQIDKGVERYEIL